jgi:hypothetical protein
VDGARGCEDESISIRGEGHGNRHAGKSKIATSLRVARFQSFTERWVVVAKVRPSARNIALRRR